MLDNPPPEDLVNVEQNGNGEAGAPAPGVAVGRPDLGRQPSSLGPAAFEPRGGPPLIVEGHIDWQKSLRGLLRYRWLILALTALGVTGGVAAYRFFPEEFVARGAIWVQQDTDDEAGGPIRSGGLLQREAWLDLLHSYAVLDPVVISQELRIVPKEPEDAAFVSNLVLADGYVPGDYRVSAGGPGTPLRLYRGDDLLEEEQPGRPLGSSIGMDWIPDTSLIIGRTDIEFSLVTGRDAADDLNENLNSTMARGSFIEVELSGRHPERQAAVVNSVMDQFVEVASELKTGTLNERVAILSDQLDTVRNELIASERSLESFRVQTITLPSERGLVVTPGLQSTRDPAFTNYYELKEQAGDLSNDRERLVRALADMTSAGVRVESFVGIESADNSSELTNVLTQLTEKRQELRSLQLRYTDEHPPVARLIEEVRLIEDVSAPQVTRQLIEELGDQEEVLSTQLDAAATELAQIPPRSIEEARLSRSRDIADRLYIELRQRYEEASLEAASSIPDVRILDRSVPPDVPNADQRLILAILLAMGGLGLGIVSSLLLERMDPRLREVSDVTTDMGFDMLGAIPNAPTGSSRQAQIDRNSVVEAFRALRLSTSYAFGASGPVLVSVTSPAPQEGKTTVSVNLALAFSELGKKTLLIDADTRRGDLHEPFQLNRNPGLVNFLSDGATHDEIVRHVRDNLDVVTCGERSSKSPELVSSSRMINLIGEAKTEYDVIIVDSPPIGAGSDAFVLGTICGSMILVMRSGKTDMGYAEVMTEPLRRLPVRLLGVVLNDIKPGSGTGTSKYYADYLPDYGATDELVQIG